ncbi:FAD:protein FMN transferase [Rhodopirellula sp. SWK7]|uniref:FAD:protein FMN transferase n=1 Tax=Rhodopirellula sp. SWK7 TaxID=595460 RepID=UPI0002BD7293|nr:FAD:protein FMN transferase [Rhodopirellula sp. SWK7]EMI41771.1 thiamine biosynthesis lipoprotein apbE [Rhodopirellula sp. SWK7]
MSQRNRMTRRGYSPVAFFLMFTIAVVAGLGGGWLSGNVVQAQDSSAESTAAESTAGETPQMIAFRGATMGTTYSVKVSDPPDGDDWAEEASLAVDAELRRVNDQMSTYLASSELSRFNESTSTDWFDVSAETAEVVAFALEVGEASGGRFDVTVGPLVDRWSFGPGERNQDVPSDTELEQIGERIGQEHLQARIDPPALKKAIGELRVDLSAIAKGHGVDRVVELLLARGAKNVFVEIGGEVRVFGAKITSSGTVPWLVGIQRPDAENNKIAVAHPMKDSAMATSGDYRNYFEVDGERYSHTIDPVTRRPVRHDLASVTVIASTCMAADAWATALNVLGPERAIELANENDLDTLLMTRGGVAGVRQSDETNGNEGNQMNVIGTGTLAAVAEQMMMAQAATAEGGGFGERMMPILVLTAIGFGAVLIAMAVGVIFGRKSISGSCGGLNARTDPDGVSRCSMCSTPSEGCKELREKIENGQSAGS